VKFKNSTKPLRLWANTDKPFICGLLPSPYLDPIHGQYVIELKMTQPTSGEEFTIKRPFGQIYQYRSSHAYSNDISLNKTKASDGEQIINSSTPIDVCPLKDTPFGNAKQYTNEELDETCLIFEAEKGTVVIQALEMIRVIFARKRCLAYGFLDPTFFIASHTYTITGKTIHINFTNEMPAHRNILLELARYLARYHGDLSFKAAWHSKQLHKSHDGRDILGITKIPNLKPTWRVRQTEVKQNNNHWYFVPIVWNVLR
jgi:hypothetical protein